LEDFYIYAVSVGFFLFLLYLIPKHHPSEEMLNDMTMCHPVSGIAHIYKYIYILVFWDEDCVFPDKIGIDCSILIQHKESLPMHMKWVLHWMHCVFIVGKSDFDYLGYGFLYDSDYRINISIDILNINVTLFHSEIIV